MYRSIVKGSILAATIFFMASFAVHPLHGDTVNFQLEGQAGSGLLPGNEVGGATSSGSGGIITEIILDLDTNELFIDVGWGSGNGFTDLTGDASAMHIHGPADFFTNAGVQYGLDNLPGFDGSATNGGFNGTITIDNEDLQDLQDGLFYLNIHTAANNGGELRANLVQAVPEPGSLGVLVLGASLFLRRRPR